MFTDVFRSGHPYLRQAALRAAADLELPAAASGPVELAELARRLGVGEARLRALVDVLVLEGVLSREGPLLRIAAPFPPLPPPGPAEGWGCLAEVLRHGRPLEEPDPQRRRAELAAYHAHLLAVGAGPAGEVAERWGRDARRVLDAGGGAGAYAAALLDAFPRCRLTLVDQAEVLALAAVRLGEAVAAGRAELVEADLRTMAVEPVFDLVLLVHVLHLHGAADAAALVGHAAAALAPGGRLLVKELRLAPDRSGPPAALYFALNMALYTPAGDVWPVGQIVSWMAAAGLAAIEQATLATSPETVILLGRC